MRSQSAQLHQTLERHCSQPLGNRLFDNLCWLHTYQITAAAARAQAAAGEISEADQLSLGDRPAGLACQPPAVFRPYPPQLGTRGLQPHCHRRMRLGGSNLNTVYESAWRAANAGLHGGLSNVIIWDSSTFPHRFQPS